MVGKALACQKVAVIAPHGVIEIGLVSIVWVGIFAISVVLLRYATIGAALQTRIISHSTHYPNKMRQYDHRATMISYGIKYTMRGMDRHNDLNHVLRDTICQRWTHPAVM